MAGRAGLRRPPALRRPPDPGRPGGCTHRAVRRAPLAPAVPGAAVRRGDLHRARARAHPVAARLRDQSGGLDLAAGIGRGGGRPGRGLAASGRPAARRAGDHLGRPAPLTALCGRARPGDRLVLGARLATGCRPRPAPGGPLAAALLSLLHHRARGGGEHPGPSGALRAVRALGLGTRGAAGWHVRCPGGVAGRRPGAGCGAGHRGRKAVLPAQAPRSHQSAGGGRGGAARLWAGPLVRAGPHRRARQQPGPDAPGARLGCAARGDRARRAGSCRCARPWTKRRSPPQGRRLRPISWPPRRPTPDPPRDPWASHSGSPQRCRWWSACWRSRSPGRCWPCSWRSTGRCCGSSRSPGS